MYINADTKHSFGSKLSDRKESFAEGGKVKRAAVLTAARLSGPFTSIAWFSYTQYNSTQLNATQYNTPHCPWLLRMCCLAVFRSVSSRLKFMISIYMYSDKSFCDFSFQSFLVYFQLLPILSQWLPRIREFLLICTVRDILHFIERQCTLLLQTISSPSIVVSKFVIKIAPQSLIKKVLTCCGKKCNFKRYLAAFFIDYQIKSICPAALVK